MHRAFFKSRLQLAALITVVSFSACTRKNETPQHFSARMPSATVRVQKLELIDFGSTEEVVGTVRSKIHATLEAKQSGRIEKMPMSLGDTVRAGDLVARLDSGETTARVEQAQASMEQAEREWKRVSALFDQQSATRAERDSAEAHLRIAKGAVDEAKASAGHAEVVAPFNGVIAKKWADVGDLAAPGRPIVDIEDPSILQVEVDLPEGLPIPLKPDMPFDVLASGGNTRAVLREISPAFDPTTRTRKLKLELSNAPGIFPGQFVRVSVPQAVGKALVAPEAAIVDRGQLQIAFSVENQHARMRLVKIGRKSREGVEILSGLKAGDVVVIEGAERLNDGQTLEVR